MDQENAKKRIWTRNASSASQSTKLTSLLLPSCRKKGTENCPIIQFFKRRQRLLHMRQHTEANQDQQLLSKRLWDVAHDSAIQAVLEDRAGDR